MDIHKGHFAYYLTSQVLAIGVAMRASHKTVDRLLSGFPDPGWGALLWKVAEVMHTKINIIITIFIIIIIITIIIILLLLSGFPDPG